MTYDSVINTIENKRRFGKASGREVTVEMLQALEHPEQGMQIIHIAGTNGKGSVAAFVSSILQAASFASAEHFRVGTFTSPHLIDFTERIMVDGVQIPQEAAARIGQQLLKLQLSLEPTMFDYCLAMALIYFREQGVRYVVLETGLGGAKDSTSGLSTVPVVSAITSIGLEHTAILGNTLGQIAGEKAGILKAGTQLVMGQLPQEARQVILQRCQELSVPYYEPQPVEPGVQLGLFGDYQRGNAAVAAQVARLLDINISEEAISKGLAQASWPGRMQVISTEPYILVDGAHNPNGVEALYSSLRQAFPGEKFTFIMAVMADKDYVEMASMMKEIISGFYTCSVDYSRALQSDELAWQLQAVGIPAQAMPSFDAALAEARLHDERIVVFGSLYFIGQVLRDYRGRL